MFQLYKNIQTDFLGQIFLELFQSKTQSYFWGTQQSYCIYSIPADTQYKKVSMSCYFMDDIFKRRICELKDKNREK